MPSRLTRQCFFLHSQARCQPHCLEGWRVRLTRTDPKSGDYNTGPASPSTALPRAHCIRCNRMNHFRISGSEPSQTRIQRNCLYPNHPIIRRFLIGSIVSNEFFSGIPIRIIQKFRVRKIAVVRSIHITKDFRSDTMYSP